MAKTKNINLRELEDKLYRFLKKDFEQKRGAGKVSNFQEKLYKESSFFNIKMIPSDPTGLLDEIFSKRGLL